MAANKMCANNCSSYPPAFLELNPPDTALPISSDGVDDDAGDNCNIPLLDFQALDPQSLSHACTYWGIFRLLNHGVPPDLCRRLRTQATRVFSLPFELKQANMVSSPVKYFWGSPAVTCNVENVNWLEGLQYGLQSAPTNYRPRIDDPNTQQAADRCHDLVEDLRDAVEEYGVEMARVAKTLFDAMADPLRKGQEQRHSCLWEKGGMVRVYRYPRCPAPGSILGMEAHTDSSLISILNLDDVPGLQLLNDGHWLPLRNIPNTLVVNLGDMMQAISNDEYKSVMHRVSVNQEKERMSVCYFVFPKDDCVIQSSNYRPFSYEEYREKVRQDIKTTGFKVGLQRFKLPLRDG